MDPPTIANMSNLILPSHTHTTQQSSTNAKCNVPLDQGIAIVIINLLLVVLGTFGNFLIVFAVLKTPRLRHRVSNFLLLSLAIADLLVTMVAQPLNAVSMAFKTIDNRCIDGVDLAYDIAGNFSFFCSVFHLSAISVDRALVVTKPHQHHDIMSKRGLKIMLLSCWGTAAVFVCLRVPFPSTLMLSIALIVVNYVIIIVSYTVILYQITHEPPNDPLSPYSCRVSRDARMERRVAGTISIIILFFSLCCLPLVVFYITLGKGLLRDIGSVTYMWIRTLALSNSSMNFIVYSYRINHFRTAYVRILRNICRKPRQVLRIPKTNSFGVTTQSGRDVNILELGCPGLGKQGSYSLKTTYTNAPTSTSIKEKDT